MTNLPSRLQVLIVMFVVPITFGSIIGFLVAGDSAPLQLGLFITTAVLYLVAFAGIGLGISMIVSTSVRATALTFGSFFGFFLFWDIIVNTIFTLVDIPSDSPLFFVALRLSPQNAFQALSNIVLGIGNAVGPYYTVYRVTQEGMRTNLYIAPTTLDTMPIYLHGWVSVLTLVGWAVVPLVAGQLVFTHRDL